MPQFCPFAPKTEFQAYSWAVVIPLSLANSEQYVPDMASAYLSQVAMMLSGCVGEGTAAAEVVVEAVVVVVVEEELVGVAGGTESAPSRPMQ